MRKMLGVVLLLVAVGALFWGYHRRKYPAGDVEAFDSAVTQALEQLPAEASGSTGRVSPGVLCVRVPDLSPGLQRHVAGPFLLGSVIRVPENSMRNTDREARHKLDALAQAGFFARQVDNEAKSPGSGSLLRYTLTLKGWAVTDYRNGSPCFVYAHQENLGVGGFSRVEDEKDSGRILYRVTARLGVRHPEALPDWARAPSVREAFPSIAHNLSGVTRVFVFERVGGQWRSPASQPEARQSFLPEQMRGQAPTEQEIRSLLTARTDWSGHGYCVAMPNGRQAALPVDRNLSGQYAGQYAVAVFDGGGRRSERDPVLQRTLPYLRSLQTAGVLVSQQVLLPGLRQMDHREMASVFEFSPGFADRLRPGDAMCLSPGQPDPEIVDVQVVRRADARGLPDAYRYKVRLHFSHPPAWMEDVRLQQVWPELAHVLHDGWACQGEFAFDRKTRSSAGGAENCGWAFESVARPD